MSRHTPASRLFAVVATCLLATTASGCVFGRADPEVAAVACAPDVQVFAALAQEPALMQPLAGAAPAYSGVPPSYDVKTGRCGTTVKVVRWPVPAESPMAALEELAQRLLADGWTDVTGSAIKPPPLCPAETREEACALPTLPPSLRGFAKTLAGEEVALRVEHREQLGVIEARGRRAASG